MAEVEKKFWKIPAFGIFAGLICCLMVIHVLGRWVVVTLPDGSLSADLTRQLAVYGVLFVGTVLAGGLLVARKMERREAFLSASILVGFELLCVGMEWLCRDLDGSQLSLAFFYLDECFAWSEFLDLLFYRLTDRLWLGAVLQSLAPYLFVLFAHGGKDTGEER